MQQCVYASGTLREKILEKVVFKPLCADGTSSNSVMSCLICAGELLRSESPIICTRTRHEG